MLFAALITVLIPFLFACLIICLAFVFNYLLGWLKAIPAVLGLLVLGLAWYFFGWGFAIFGALVAVFSFLALRDVLGWKGIWVVLLIATVVFGAIQLGVFRIPLENTPLATVTTEAPVVTEAPACPTAVVTEAPACPTEIVIAPTPIVCNPYDVFFEDKGELNPNVKILIAGPAIYEWWTGGKNEGVQRVDAGSSITILGVKGHWWILPDQQGLDCAWSLHVYNYGAKPQHEGKTYNQLVVPPPAEFLAPK